MRNPFTRGSSAGRSSAAAGGELGGAPARSCAGLVAGLVLVLLAGPASAQLGKRGTQQHRHDGSSSGGTRLDPSILNVSGSATFTQATLTGGAKLRNHTSTTTVDFWSARGTFSAYNDTKPTQAQGFMLVNTTYTPVNANSTLVFEGLVEACEPSNTMDEAWLAIYEGDTQAAKCAGGNTYFGGANVRPITMKIKCELPAASTTARVYSLRVHNDTASNSIAVNGCATRFLGGVQVSGLYIDEVAP